MNINVWNRPKTANMSLRKQPICFLLFQGMQGVILKQGRRAS